MNTSIFKGSVIVFSLILLGKALSFYRDVLISKFFGSDYLTDAYFAANNIPSILFAAIISSFLVLITPIYSKIVTESGKTSADLFISKLINIFLLFTITLSVCAYVFMPYLIKLVGSGFEKKTLSEAIQMGQILVLSFPFSSITMILATVSVINNKFYALNIIPVLSSLLTIFGIVYFSEKWGIYALIWFALIAFIIQIFIQIFISRNDFKYSFNFNFNDKNVKTIFWLVLPIFLGYSVDQINLLVNTNISSGLKVGSLSNLNYAIRLQATIIGTISTAVMTVIYPIISRLYSENKNQEFIKLIKEGVIGVTLILLPLLIFLFFNSKPLVSMVYYRGDFDENALNSTSEIFTFYVLAVIFIAIREILLRVFYIQNNVRTPLVISLISMLLNIVLSFYLVKYFDVSGLALANLIATILSFVLIYISFTKNLDIKISYRALFGYMQKILFPSFILVITTYLESHYIDNFTNPAVFISLLVLNYLAFTFLLLIFGQREAIQLKNRLLKKMKL